jgi:hypothetical protein
MKLLQVIAGLLGWKTAAVRAGQFTGTGSANQRPFPTPSGR